MKTKELFFFFFVFCFFFFVFVSFFNCYDLICKWWSQHVRVVGTLGIEGWMKSVSILTFFCFFRNEWIIQSLLLPPYSQYRSSYQSEIWLAQRLPRIASCQVLYNSTCIDCWLLFILKEFSPMSTVRELPPPRLFPGDRRYVRWYCFLSFPSGVIKSVILNP